VGRLQLEEFGRPRGELLDRVPPDFHVITRYNKSSLYARGGVAGLSE
jgi:hypothetical protein